MGSNIYAEKAPYKINVWKGGISDPEGIGSRWSTENTFLDELLKHVCFEDPFSQNGWSVSPSDEEYGELLPYVLVKGPNKVYHVNESPYAAGAEEDICFFADEKESLEQLCKDAGLDSKSIKQNATVRQTL